jgi:PST family polysaccharide transporter
VPKQVNLKDRGSAASESSYGTIVKSSSIIGGSQGLGYIIGLFRAKLVAILIGPEGVGLVGIYNSIVRMGMTVSGMGMGSSGVRAIANARERGDLETVAQLQLALRRLALVFGVVACLSLIACSGWISDYVFQNKAYVWAIGLLGVVLIVDGMKTALAASLQGFRKIGDLARTGIIGAVLSLGVAAAYYVPFGMAGILPVLITLSVVGLALTYKYYRSVEQVALDRTWRTSLRHGRALLSLGLALAFGSLLAEFVPFFARALVMKELGAEANGYYVAAWAISGLFINFLLSAMWADYYPRLSAAVDDGEKKDRLVNEQTEIGIIAALPGVLLMFLMAPVIIRILYSGAFEPAAALLPWFLVGLFGRILCFPMGVILHAHGHAKTTAFMTIASTSAHVGWLYLLFRGFALEGLAMGYAIHQFIYLYVLRLLANKRYSYSWDRGVLRLLLVALLGFLCAALLRNYVAGFAYWGGALLLIGLATGFSGMELYSRMHKHPKLVALVQRLPQALQRRLLF